MSNVLAISDINESLLNSTADNLCIERRYKDWHDLVKDPDIDIVHVCAPNFMHYDIAKSAILNGKHVVCEKPMVTTIEQAEELVNLSSIKNKIGAVSYNLRFYPLVQQTRSMILNNEIGKLYTYHGVYLQDWLLFDTDYSWRLDSAVSGPSRAFADIGAHWLDMAEYVMGKKVVSLCADIVTYLPVRRKPKIETKTFEKSYGKIEYEDVNIETEDYAGILFRFEDGIHGTLTVSQVSAGRKNMMLFEADGSKASLAWNSENPNELWIGHRDAPNGQLIKDPGLMNMSVKKYASFPGGHAEGYPDSSKQFMKEVYSYILNGGFEGGKEPTFPTFKDGLREVRLSDAVIQSGKTSSWVKV